MKLTRRTKEKIARYSRGTITIFLVIILLPILSVAGLIVDASRYQVAKAEVAAAADLAENTALADYDTVLKDVYGLFAMSQSSDDLSANLEAYFTQTLIANGVVSSESEIKGNERLKALIEGLSGMGDLLKMDVASFDAEKVSGSELAQAQVLKNQIVEYSKYRAPVHLILEIIECIKGVKDSKEQVDIVEKETEVGEAEQDYNTELEKVWRKCSKYQEEYRTSGASLEKPTTISGTTTTYRWVYENAVEAVKINDVLESLPTVTMSSGTKSHGVSGTGTSRTESSKGSAIDNYSFSGQISKSLTSNEYYYNSMSASDLAKSVDDNEAISYVNSMLKTLKQGKPADSFSSNMDVSKGADYVTQVNAYLGHLYYLYRFYNLYSNKSVLDNCSAGNNFRIQNAFAYGFQYIKNLSDYKETLKNETDKWDAYLSSVATDCSEKITAAKSLAQLAKDALNAIDDAVEELSNMESKNDAFGTAVSGYQATDSTQEFRDSESDTYGKNKENIEKYRQELQTLKSTLSSIRSYYTEVQGYLESIKFNGTSVTSISSLSDLKSAAGEKTPVISLYHEGNKPTAQVSCSLEDNEFYRETLSGQFDSNNKSKNQEDKEKKSKVANKGKSDAKSAGSGDEPDDLINRVLDEDVPSTRRESTAANKTNFDGLSTGDQDKGYSDMLGNVSGSINSLFDGVADIMKGARDNLYITDYAFSMFSYYTQVNEYKVQGTISSASELETESGIAINSTNNYFNRAEIEYLIYGAEKSQTNVGYAKASIFAIRLAMNLLYIFGHKDAKSVRSEAQGIGEAVCVATGGIVPATLTKVVILVSLAMAESANDLSLMMKGERVKFAKDKDSFVYDGIDAVIEKVEDALSGSNQEDAKNRSLPEYLGYGDYLKIFLFLRLAVNNAGTVLRIGDLIQMNITHGLVDSKIGKAHALAGSADEKGTFLLSNAFTYVKVDVQVNLNTMFMNYPLITNYNNKTGVASFGINYTGALGY